MTNNLFLIHSFLHSKNECLLYVRPCPSGKWPQSICSPASHVLSCAQGARGPGWSHHPIPQWISKVSWERLWKRRANDMQKSVKIAKRAQISQQGKEVPRVQIWKHYWRSAKPKAEGFQLFRTKSVWRLTNNITKCPEKMIVMLYEYALEEFDIARCSLITVHDRFQAGSS